MEEGAIVQGTWVASELRKGKEMDYPQASGKESSPTCRHLDCSPVNPVLDF